MLIDIVRGCAQMRALVIDDVAARVLVVIDVTVHAGWVKIVANDQANLDTLGGSQTFEQNYLAILANSKMYLTILAN